MVYTFVPYSMKIAKIYNYENKHCMVFALNTIKMYFFISKKFRKSEETPTTFLGFLITFGEVFPSCCDDCWEICKRVHPKRQKFTTVK